MVVFACGGRTIWRIDDCIITGSLSYLSVISSEDISSRATSIGPRIAILLEVIGVIADIVYKREVRLEVEEIER